MAKRWRPPFNYKRFCGDTESMVIHDLVYEKPACAVSRLPDERIQMFESVAEAEAAVAGGAWARHEPCLSGALYFTPREQI